MVFSTNKEIWNSSLGLAISYFCTQGYTVSIPLNDTQDYDLIVEKQGKLSRAQVKGTSFKTKYGVYQVALKSSDGTLGKFYKTIKDTEVELLFVVIKEQEIYLIPNDIINNTYTLNLGEEYLKYRL